MNKPEYPKEHLRGSRHQKCRHGLPAQNFCTRCNAEARKHALDPRPSYVPTSVMGARRMPNRDAR